MSVEQNSHAEQSVSFLHPSSKPGNVSVQGLRHIVDLLWIALPGVCQLLRRLQQLLRVKISSLPSPILQSPTATTKMALADPTMVTREAQQMSLCPAQPHLSVRLAHGLIERQVVVDGRLQNWFHNTDKVIDILTCSAFWWNMTDRANTEDLSSRPAANSFHTCRNKTNH
ncbi:hypothetical protein E2C01_016987 [Portunus trituberculatus]|uniref:Uncharacterized protein n=1 Tax=Portunus trituberculatus TaxID=210409 RepID=A0A5B7DR34_PORTR|nr:hypothetical protein [Portunus trituberculatus]